MRDYSNMPVLDWHDKQAVNRAKAQILHQEPVVLQMPDDFQINLATEMNADAPGREDEYDCTLETDSGILTNCNGAKVLDRLADLNDQPGLRRLAEACAESSSQVDLDCDQKRIIVHD